MMSPDQLHEELRQRILALPGVTERPRAGIHEDAFFVAGKMFMHIHGYGLRYLFTDGRSGTGP